MILKGISLSPGVAVGKAFRLDPGWGPHQIDGIRPEEVEGEIARFESACKSAEADLLSAAQSTSEAASRDKANIFDAHRALVREWVPLFQTAISPPNDPWELSSKSLREFSIGFPIITIRKGLLTYGMFWEGF